jgi:5-methyltetrahydrofolate--homocysteine methyltransferase
MLIIGENINATSKRVAEAIRVRDGSFFQELVSAQAAADYLDINVGRGGGSTEQEIEDMKWLVDIACDAADKPLVVDSADPRVIEAGLEQGKGRTVMVNSVNAEEARLEAIGPLVARYQVNVIALAMGDGGIPSRVEERIEACDRILEGLSRYSIPPERVYFDPLVLPIGVDGTQGQVTLKTLERIKAKYTGAKTTVGLSNISYGLPQRPVVNQAFLLMLIYAGLDSVIVNPLRKTIIGSVKLGQMLLGKDDRCREYLKAYRKGLFEGV